MKFLAGLLVFLALSFSSAAIAQCEEDCCVYACNTAKTQYEQSNPINDPEELSHWIWLRDKYANEKDDASIERANLDYYYFDPLETWLLNNFGVFDIETAQAICESYYGYYYCEGVYGFSQMMAEYYVNSWWRGFWVCAYDYWNDAASEVQIVIDNWVL